MKRSIVAALAVLTLVAAACEPEARTRPPAPVPPTRESPSPAPTGPGSVAEARAALCPEPPKHEPNEVRAKGPLPLALAKVVQEVERVRGLEFLKRVAADPVSQTELAERLTRNYERFLDDEYLDRKSLAWATIGAIPEGSSIKEALLEFAGGQVAGYYVPATGKLVFIGDTELSPSSHVVLAHELTHAIDDQHYDLDRLDRLAERCLDDDYDAAVAAVEGSAQWFSLAVAGEYLTPAEQLSLGDVEVPPLGDVPPFIARIQFWPYTAGLAFVTSVQADGGLGALDAALEDLPVSTEQIIHPERYPNDQPQDVDVADLGPELGGGFEDLDVQEVGEEWLQILLDLRLDAVVAQEAAAGWDGGTYRAWSDGEHVAVLMETVWDRSGDAEEFARAMDDWLAEAERTGFVEQLAGSATVGFASDETTLEALRAAA